MPNRPLTGYKHTCLMLIGRGNIEDGKRIVERQEGLRYSHFEPQPESYDVGLYVFKRVN